MLRDTLSPGGPGRPGFPWGPGGPCGKSGKHKQTVIELSINLHIGVKKKKAVADCGFATVKGGGGAKSVWRASAFMLL